MKLTKKEKIHAQTFSTKKQKNFLIFKLNLYRLVYAK
jgi:hypothetical protein